MQSSQEEGNPSAPIKASSSIARQVLKHKLISKGPKASQDLQLEKIIGITSKGRNSFAFNPVTGDLAYPAGSIATLYTPRTLKQRYFFSPSRKSITALCFSPDGKYLAVASKGLDISIWDLHSANTQPEFVLKGHKYGIENIMFSPNMKYFVSIGDNNDKGLFVWDWNAETILTKNKVSKKINSAMFSPSGQYLITVGEQHVKFWFFDPMGNILYAKPKDSGNTARENASDSSSITNITNTTTTTATSTPNIIEGKGANLGIMGDKIFMDLACYNQQVYAITLDGILCIINESKRAIEKWMDLKVPSGYSVQITNEFLICGCGDGFIRFFKITNMEHVFFLPKPPSLGSYNIEKGVATKLTSKPNEKYADVIAITYDSNNQKMATLYSDRTVFVWEMKNTERIVVYRSFLNHSGAVYDIQPLPAMSSYEITFFATGSTDKTVRVWHLADSENKENEKVIKKNVYCRGLSKILYVSENYDHFKYQYEDDVDNYTLQDYQIRCIRCSPAGDYIAAGDQTGSLRIYGVANWELSQEFKAHDQEILCMDFSPENEDKVRFLATGSRDRLIHVYDLDKEFNLAVTLDDHTSSISSLRFAYDKSTKQLSLISCGADKTLIFRVYNSKNRNFDTTHVEVDKNNKFYSLELNQESTQMVAGQDKKISIWQIDTGKQKCAYETKDEDINAKNTYLDNLKVVVDMTGSYIAVSNKDGTVRIRDYYTGNLVAKVNCGDLSTGMCFTQNNKTLITTTADGCILAWSLPEEMTNNMNKKKSQLGIFVKKLREMMESEGNENSLLKDFKYDSLLIEHELQEYISKQKLEEKEKIGAGTLLDEVEKSSNIQGAQQGVKEKEPSTKEKEKEKATEKIFNTSNLPTWARTQAPQTKEIPKTEGEKEEKSNVAGKWGKRLENQDEGSLFKSDEKGEPEKKPSILDEKRRLSPIKETESHLFTPPLTEEKQKEKSETPQSTPEERKEEPKILEKRALDKEKTPEPEQVETDEEEMPQTYKTSINMGHGMHINVNSVQKEAEEDIPEEDLSEEKVTLEDLIEERLEEADEDIEKAIEQKLKSPYKGVQQERSKFIEQSYENLDDEVLTSPGKSPLRQSLSSLYLQNKSNSKDFGKKKENDNEVDFEFQLEDEKETNKSKDQTTESQGVIKYKAGGIQQRESLFDVNAIKSQVSNVSKTLETLEQQLATKDNNKLPKNFPYFDQSKTFLSSFDAETEKGENYVRLVEPGSSMMDKVVNEPQQKERASPGVRQTPERGMKSTEKESNLSSTPNNSGVLKVDKRNLVPTTLEQLASKRQITPNTSQSDVAKQEVMDKSLESNKQKETKTPKEDDIEENPHELTIKSEKYEFKPDRFTLQPSYLPEASGKDKKTETAGDILEYASPFATNFGEQSSIKYGSEWEEEPIALSYNTSAFQKVVHSNEEKAEAELEESFNIIKAQLSKIDFIMRNSTKERNFALKERLTDKFEKGYDETRKSVDMLGVRSSRSMYSQDISQNMNNMSMSEMVIANSKDLLENYSKMLLKTFEKQLEEKLGKK